MRNILSRSLPMAMLYASPTKIQMKKHTVHTPPSRPAQEEQLDQARQETYVSDKARCQLSNGRFTERKEPRSPALRANPTKATHYFVVVAVVGGLYFSFHILFRPMKKIRQPTLSTGIILGARIVPDDSSDESPIGSQ